MKPIRMLISCSSPLFCAGVASLLRKEEDIRIIEKNGEGSQALENMHLRPDVLVLDSLLFKQDELPRIVQELKKTSPRTRILLLFPEADMHEESLMQCLMRGADGYIKNTTKQKQLVAAVRTVHAGNIWADRKLLEKFVRYAPDHLSEAGLKTSRLAKSLTNREKEIISFLFLGLSNRLISQKLHISEKTVKTHLNNIFKKMQVHNRTQVVSSLMQFHKN